MLVLVPIMAITAQANGEPVIWFLPHASAASHADMSNLNIDFAIAVAASVLANKVAMRW